MRLCISMGKHALLIMIFLLSFQAYSEQKTSVKIDLKAYNYWKPLLLSQKYSDGELTENEYVGMLNQCSKEEAGYCAASLGEYYSVRKKQYDRAYPLLLEASKDTNAPSSIYEPPTVRASYLLGQMYADGIGVLQNDDKAIEYFKKSVTYGSDRNSAMRLALIYTKKWREESTDYRINEFLTHSYAWWKVALALPKSDIPIKTIDGSELEPQKDIRKFENFDEFRPNIKLANKLAQQICSTIPKCVQ
jgi:TPR repeat protein